MSLEVNGIKVGRYNKWPEVKSPENSTVGYVRREQSMSLPGAAIFYFQNEKCFEVDQWTVSAFLERN